MTRKRLFFALWPDEMQRESLGDSIGPVVTRLKGKHVDRGNWHVTTAFIGGFEVAMIPALQTKAAQIVVKPFSLGFDSVEFWPRPRVACLIATTVPPELGRLVSALNDVLADFDIPVEHRSYRPHVTIVRRVQRFENQRLARPLVMEWSGFELIESIARPGGAVYRPVKQ